jgi:hypothetical protein
VERCALPSAGATGTTFGEMRRHLVRRFTACFPAILTLAACGGGGGGGTPSKDAPWIGNTYVLAIPDGNWSKPPNIGSDVGAFVPQFLIGVSQGSGNTITVTLGTAASGVQDAAANAPQDTCNVTTVIPGVDGSGYPNATITADALPLRIVNTAFTPPVVVDTTVRNFTLTNVLPNGSTTMKMGSLSAVLDISELYPLFNQIPASSRTPDGVCGVLQTEANTSCAACPTTGQPYCLTLEAVQLGAVESTTALMPIASNQVPASCAPTVTGTPPAEEAGAPSEAGTGTEPGADAAVSSDAGGSADASEPATDGSLSGMLDAHAATDARGDSQ